MKPIRTAIEKTIRKKTGNIFCIFYNGYLEHALCDTEFSLYGFLNTSVFQWPQYLVENKPNNLHFLEEYQVTDYSSLSFDFVLCHDKLRNYNIAKHIADLYNIPLVCINHLDSTILNKMENFKFSQMVSDAEYSIDKIGYPIKNLNYDGQKKEIDLLIYADFNQTDFPFLQNILNNIPNCKLIGYNHGLSNHCFSWMELREYFSKTKVYLDLSNIYINHGVYEAILNRCKVVTTNNLVYNLISTEGSINLLDLNKTVDVCKESIEKYQHNDYKIESYKDLIENWKILFKENLDEIYIK